MARRIHMVVVRVVRGGGDDQHVCHDAKSIIHDY